MTDRPINGTANFRLQIVMIFPSSLLSLSQGRWMVAGRDLRWVQDLIPVVAGGDGETHCSKVRPK